MKTNIILYAKYIYTYFKFSNFLGFKIIIIFFYQIMRCLERVRVHLECAFRSYYIQTNSHTIRN